MAIIDRLGIMRRRLLRLEAAAFELLQGRSYCPVRANYLLVDAHLCHNLLWSGLPDMALD